MLIKKKVLLLLVCIASGVLVQAQYTLNSPYSKYGFGDLNTSGLSFNRGLGGTGIAFRETNTINYLNPASYTSQDSMSFIWDFGMIGNSKTSSTTSSSMSMNTMNFDHLTFSFPVTRKYFVSVGVLPYSKVGYKLFEEAYASDSSKYISQYEGSGNLNQLYFGHAVSLLKKQMSIGLNVQYLFGSIEHKNTVTFPIDVLGSALAQNAKLSGWNFVLGIQGKIKASENLQIILGATYQTPTSFSGDFNKTVYNNNGKSIYADSLPADYKIPARLGLGMSVQIKDKILAGIDYTMQDWSKARLMSSYGNTLKASNRLGGGIQVIPNKDSYVNYFSRVRYRVGAYYESSYIKINNNDINDYGLTVGLGLPFKRTNTMFNMALEYGVRGTTSNDLIRENYYRITMSVSLYDFWFIKRKYQ